LADSELDDIGSAFSLDALEGDGALTSFPRPAAGVGTAITVAAQVSDETGLAWAPVAQTIPNRITVSGV
jgi:hypothetical protein